MSLSLAAGAATADILVVPEGEPIPEIRLPAKGTTMADVEKNYGAPRVKQPTVGGSSPQQPPITRWDFDGFAVIFERDRVVDGVIPGAPPKIYNRDELETVAVPAMPAVLPPWETAPAPEPEQAPESLDSPAPAPAQ